MSAQADVEYDIDGPWDHGTFLIQCTTLPRPDLANELWELYEQSFGPLRILAAARQVFTREEFDAELADPRVWKYLALDREGIPVGLTTMTNHITAMPWLSPEYFAHRYPAEWRRHAVYYVGVILVRPDRRRDRIFSMLTRHLGQRVAAAGGVLGYDMCGYNDHSRGLARAIEHRSIADFEYVEAVDVQTYYVAHTSRDQGTEQECNH